MTTKEQQAALGFVVCVNNAGYPASLEVGRSYKALPDPNAVSDGEIRVVDESGEDYLYPAGYFAAEEEALVAPANLVPESDIAREARGFIEENEPFIETGSATVLGRIFVHGTNIFTTFNEEVVESANNAAAAKDALAAGIRNPATPPKRLGELEADEARASAIYEARIAASRELDAFLNRVKEKLDDRRGEP